MVFYPLGDSVNAQTDALAASTDGQHILGAALVGGGITLSDIGVGIPTTECPVSTSGTAPNQVQTLSPLTIDHALNQASLNVNATAVNQVVPSPESNLAFITYSGSTGGASLPYYVPGTCVPGSGDQPPTCAAGTVKYLPLTGSANITAPLAGAFSPDDQLFFVSTAGDDQARRSRHPADQPQPAGLHARLSRWQRSRLRLLRRRNRRSGHGHRGEAPLHHIRRGAENREAGLVPAFLFHPAMSPRHCGLTPQTLQPSPSTLAPPSSPRSPAHSR
jgi:hypothetical protein